MTTNSCPVTIISGFLGAGKTTLVGHLLSHTHQKIAVICNEFGEDLGIESAVMVDAAGQPFKEWYDLANGCTVRDDLVRTVEAVLEKNKFDHVVIETTGLADPGPIATKFWLDEGLASPILLNAVVAVVDAKNISSQLHMVEAKRQIATADLVVINKIDLARADDDVTTLKRRIMALNPLCTITTCTRSAVDESTLLSYRGLSRDIMAMAMSSSSVQSSDARHTENVETVFIHDERRECKSVATFEQWLGSLVWDDLPAARDKQVLLFRYKGALAFTDEEDMYMLQGVNEVFEVTRTPKKKQQSDAGVKMVFIGLNLHLLRIKETFDRYMSSSHNDS